VPKLKKDRLELVNEVDVGSMYEKLGPREIEQISKTAWGQAIGVRILQRSIQDKTYNKMNYRRKQKAIVEFMAGLIVDPCFQVRFTEWVMEHPGDAMKMFLTTVPKEAEVTVNHEGGVVLLVPKMDSIEDWQKEMAQQTIDVTPAEVEGA
jgi:hypothetical protein